jgi:ATP-binding cassette subfamily A (ABC1) protein 3
MRMQRETGAAMLTRASTHGGRSTTRLTVHICVCHSSCLSLLQAAENLPFFLGSLACGVVGSQSGRYPFESVALAAGPNLKGGRLAPEIIGIEMVMREAFILAGKNLSYTIPCCVKQVNGTEYVPDCYLNATRVEQYVEDPTSIIVQTFDSSDDLDAYMDNDDYGWYPDITPIQIGIIIDRDPHLPNQWTYSIRANSSDVPFTGTVLNTLISNYSRSDFFTYYDNHVLTFQWMIESFILASAKLPVITAEEKSFAFGPSPSLFAADESLPDGAIPLPLFDVSFVPFPFAAHKQDNFKSYVGQVFGLFLVVAFMWPFSRMVRNMVEEKEKKLSEGMKMMGLRNSVFWMSWVVTYLISFTIVCILVIAVSKLSLFKYSDIGILFAFFFSFCLSLISLACLVTTFFSRAKTAGTLSPFLLLAGYLPYFSVSAADQAVGVKNLSCLLSPVAFSLGSTQIISFEGVFIGSQWNNSSTMIDNFCLSTAITLMFFDAFLYAVLAWYLDKIWPREYGTHLKWYFFVTPSYWRGCCSCRKRRKRIDASDQALFGDIDSPRHGLRGISVTTSSPARPAFSSGAPIASYGAPGSSAPLLDDPVDEVEPDFGPDYEPVPENMRSKVGVKIRGLRKEFSRDGNDVVAVNSLDLNLYQGQCFVLLGHNGAGKVRRHLQ